VEGGVSCGISGTVETPQEEPSRRTAFATEKRQRLGALLINKKILAQKEA